MNYTSTACRARFAAAALLTTASGLFAQTAATPTPDRGPAKPAAEVTPATQSPEEEVILLNTFEVSQSKDNSYGALESNSLAAFRMELAKVPVTAEVFTQDFMNDIGATSLEDVLTGYAGTVTASSNNSAAGLFAPGDRDGAQGLSIRGVSAGEIKRDGFIGVPNNARTASGNTDNFSVERIDVISGPQSLLYGSVSGGGVINSVTKRAQFSRQKTSARVTIDQYGTKRGMLDYNYGREKIAARVALVAADNRTNRYRLGSEFWGVYGQLAFRPFKNTTVRFSTEKTDNDASVGFRPNLNNFLPATDPRRNKDARYLALTGQVSDIKVYNEPLTYENLESAADWFSSERIETHWNQMVVESKLPYGFSAQLVGIYTETIDTRVTDGRGLLPGRGSTFADGTVNPNFGTNPFSETAVAIGAPVQVNEQRDRNKGVRLALVHEGEFSIAGLKGKSQTAFGGQAFHRGPTFGSSGIAKVYYLADQNFNIQYRTAAAANSPLTTTPNFALNDYGRVPLQNVYFPVQSFIPTRPLFRPGTERIVINGQNYVLDPRIYSSPDRVTAANPFGLIPNQIQNATTPFTGNWNRGGETHSGNIYFANFTDWADGRLTTLVGYSLTQFETLNAAGGTLSPTPKDQHPGYQAGLNFQILSWLRGFAVVGTSEQAEASTNDILGRPLKNPEAKNLSPEIGLKATLLQGRLSAQLSVNPTTKTLAENKDAGTAFRDAINPDGINGRVGGGNANQRVNIDRTLSSEEFTLSANPTRNWTVRMKLTHMDGEISNDVIYQQNYNDQFYLNGGNVTYSNGTPLMVNGAGNLAGPRDTALTLAMINTPTNPYYANPDPTSGRIQSTNLRSVLMTPDPVLGTAATGATGLPISAVQYNFSSPYPNGTVPVFLSGEKNTGFNEYTFNIQNKYEFTSGFLKGVKVTGDVQTYMKNRAYYSTYPDSSGSTNSVRTTRVLYRYPTSTVVNIGLGYSYKGLPWFGKNAVWSTQVNIRNVLDQSKVWVVPTSANGTVLNARLSALPRSFSWTNTIEF